MGTLTGFSTSIGKFLMLHTDFNVFEISGFVIASAIGLPQFFGQSNLWHYSFLIGIINFFDLK